MPTHILHIACSTVLLMLIGCGIEEHVHRSALDTIKNLKAQLSEQGQACIDYRDESEKKQQELTDENTAMKAKLVSLGEDLSKVKTQAGAYLQDIGEKEKQIAELMKAQEAARKRTAMFKGLLSQFKQMIDSGKLQVEIRKGRMIVKLSDKILFDPGKDKIKKEGETALVEVTNVLAAIPERHFQVSGHTDNIPIRSRRFNNSNWDLSTARAVNVVKLMAANGMDPKRLSASGYSEYDPVDDNTSDEGRMLNRRIEITLMPNLEELPKIGD